MREWRYSSTFLTSANDEGEWSATRPSRFTPWGKSPQYPLDRRLGRLQEKYGKVQISVNDDNKSKCDSGGKLKNIKFG
jgi:hypothetical protein